MSEEVGEDECVWGQPATGALGGPSSGDGKRPVPGKRPPRFGAVGGSGESEGAGVGFGERELRGLLLWDGSVVKRKGKDAG